MRRPTRTNPRLHVLAFVALCAAAAISLSAGTTGAPGPDCIVADDGTGTVTLPPEGCAYLSPDQVHVILDGLPAGTMIKISPIHGGFLCGGQEGRGCTRGPGGLLGGEIEVFPSTLALRMTGTGDLAGFQQVVTMNASVETHVGPRTPGQPVQGFRTEIVRLDGGLVRDPLFGRLRISAGRAFGLPSPGKTTLTQLSDGRFRVESTFQVAYKIEFKGAPGTPLAGHSGVTRGTVRMAAYGIGSAN